jgi:hypothetical protein
MVCVFYDRNSPSLNETCLFLLDAERECSLRLAMAYLMAKMEF